MNFYNSRFKANSSLGVLTQNKNIDYFKYRHTHPKETIRNYNTGILGNATCLVVGGGEALIGDGMADCHDCGLARTTDPNNMKTCNKKKSQPESEIIITFEMAHKKHTFN